MVLIILMKCYELWGADGTNMTGQKHILHYSRTQLMVRKIHYLLLIAASVQEVQKYVSMWNANYDCLFFCINQKIYDELTPEQQKVVDECGKLAVEYERKINRSGDSEILNRWATENGVEITKYEDMDIDSFKKAVADVPNWYVNELENQGYNDAQELVDAFVK